MPRNKKCRRVCLDPACRMFRAASRGKPVELRLDELEALRLVDLEEFDQQEAAARMEISRGTLQRLLYSAHRRVALALTAGRSIVISDGGIAVSGPAGCDASCRFCCRKNPGAASGRFPETGKGDTMIIAVTCENDNVFQHFGRTPAFALFTVEGNRLTGRVDVPTGENGHGALAGFLKERNVDVLICGGIGGGARQALADCGIKLVGGVRGDVTEAVGKYVAGTLEADPEFTCNHHHEHGHGEGHSCQCGKH
ncbi:MAG: DUF134 domain-containing protein [Lentisphaeria bacterium]|nr:DUF134 domain-containing protein [Lentisphaeria bacterium]